jgi:hypothetical protein
LPDINLTKTEKRKKGKKGKKVTVATGDDEPIRYNS